MKTRNLLFIILTVALTSCGGKSPKGFDASRLGEEPELIIETTYGDIPVKLYKETPLHRDGFVKLASEGYFDGMLFHRVVARYVIQSGDPDSRTPKPGVLYGEKDCGYTIPAEFVPGITHKKGALGAARENDDINPEKASSGSQFYFVVNPEACAKLDGNYTVFGEATGGLDVIDKINEEAVDANDRPLKDVFVVKVRPAK
jgi:peptidyl-prolyl cis-trans isomerase B (cyclophilin B)